MDGCSTTEEGVETVLVSRDTSGIPGVTDGSAGGAMFTREEKDCCVVLVLKGSPANIPPKLCPLGIKEAFNMSFLGL